MSPKLFLPYPDIVHKCTNWDDRSCLFVKTDRSGSWRGGGNRLKFALDGKIVHDEEILPGLEHAPGAIAQLYRGDNHCKLIIAVD